MSSSNNCVIGKKFPEVCVCVCAYKTEIMGSGIAQWVKALKAKPEEPSSFLGLT